MQKGESMVFRKKFEFGERCAIGLSDDGDVVIHPNRISVHTGGAHAMFYELPTWDGEREHAEFKSPLAEFYVTMTKQTFDEMMGCIDWVRE